MTTTATQPVEARWDAAHIATILGRAEPTPEQRHVIEAPLRSMLVVAGAGSGKTETMAARVVWLVANGHLAPEEVLGLTFTRKAAGELAARIGTRLRALAAAGLWSQDPRADAAGAAMAAPDPGAAVVSTYHAYAGRIVAEHGLRLGVEPDARLLTEAAAWQLAHAVVTAYSGPMDRVWQAPATVTRAVVALSGELAEHLVTVEDLAGYYARCEQTVTALPAGVSRARGWPRQVGELLGVVAARRQLAPIVAAYAQAKRDRGCLDFADQVALAAHLARDFPDVARAERARYRVVLLDEFQDTSEAQLVLLRSLFAATDGGEQVPVMAVGDPHQSIYGWRGASATTLARFPRLFAPPNGSTRAGAEIRGATPSEWLPGTSTHGTSADRTGAAHPGPEHPGPEHTDVEHTDAHEAEVRHLSVSWRNSEGVLAAANHVAAPLVAASPITVRRLQAAPGAEAGRVEIARLETVQQEVEYVAGRIAQEWYDGTGRTTGTTAAVLCRRRTQFVPVVEALRARGLPVEVVGLGGLLTMPEVQDVVALLAVAADPGRGDRMMRLLTGAALRIGAADLDGLGAWARELRRRDRQRLAAGPPDLTGGVAQPGRADAASVPQPAEEQPSIVEAVDTLPPRGWVGPEGETVSQVGHERLADLAGRIARLRSHIGAPLAELCTEAERLLRLDVELLSRPDVPPEAARVHLDALADVAAAFAAAADRPSVEAFVAWLEVALDEERGLEAPTAAVAKEAVQVLTVHAAKGLEWDVVAVPGLVEGAFPSTAVGRSTFDEEAGSWTVPPARDKGWCVGLERLPYDLRGDADGLPTLRWASVPDLAALERELTSTYEAGGARSVAEERRLAYVAITRARRLALLTAPVWTDATTPRVTSRFLLDLRDDAATMPVVPGPWAQMPVPGPDGTTHPNAGRTTTATWPHDPLAARRATLAQAAQVWAEETTALPPDRSEAVARLEAEVAASADAGSRKDLELLAMIRERRRGAAPRPARIDLPAHLSASALVSLSADEKTFAEQLRRPMPAAPATRARAGTAFHAWVEQHYQRAAIVDIDDLPGSGDADDDMLDLADAKARFLASGWSSQEPIEVELALETNIAGIAVRGRIDAVFRHGRKVVVVDWKTGRPPTGERASAAAVQLAVYRLAYARLRDLPLDAVRAAFYYVTTGETIYPELPDPSELAALITGGR